MFKKGFDERGLMLPGMLCRPPRRLSVHWEPVFVSPDIYIMSKT